MQYWETSNKAALPRQGSSLISVAVIDITTKAAWRGESFIYLFQVMFQSLSLREAMAGTLRQEPEDRNWSRDPRGTLVCSDLFNYLSYKAQASFLRMTPPTESWALLHQLAIKKMLHTHRFYLGNSIWTIQLRFLLLRWHTMVSSRRLASPPNTWCEKGRKWFPGKFEFEQSDHQPRQL